jgi:hypothetical protein
VPGLDRLVTTPGLWPSAVTRQNSSTRVTDPGPGILRRAGGFIEIIAAQVGIGAVVESGANHGTHEAAGGASSMDEGLGVHVVAANAADAICAGVLAVRFRLTGNVQLRGCETTAKWTARCS